MTHTYHITGMTCSSCEEKVKTLLEQVSGVNKVTTNRKKNEAAINMHHHVATTLLQDALKNTKYTLTEQQVTMPVYTEESKSWWSTYKPVLLIFMYLTGITLLSQFFNQTFDFMQWMNHFMAGFFLVFSFFKLLDLQGFADSYTSYDIVAKRWRPYAYIYSFIELGLGLAYLAHLSPLFTNLVTVVVMSLSSIGVLQSVLNKRKIRCACLGAVFNLPMSTITIVEDSLMILMAGFMLFTFWV